jgi:hypothetical protein
MRTQRTVDFGRGILERSNRPSHRTALEHVRNFPGHLLLENLADGIGRSHRYRIAKDDLSASLGLDGELLFVIGLVRHRS